MRILSKLENLIENSRKDVGHFWGLDAMDGEWDRTAESMMLNSAESGHPVFRATNALEREEVRSKGKGNKSVHFS